MIKEDTHVTGSAPFALSPGRLMPPVRALTARFDIDASGDSGLAEQGAGRFDRVSLLASGESRQGFRIGELRLMVRYEDCSELAEMSAIHRLPNAPEWFCGIANLHGKLTPVFDLARYIGVPPGTGAKRMLLVLSRGTDAAGVVIDGLPERLRWSDDEHTDAGAAPERLVPRLRGARFLNGQLWFDLDPHSMLSAIEQSLEAQL